MSKGKEWGHERGASGDKARIQRLGSIFLLCLWLLMFVFFFHTHSTWRDFKWKKSWCLLWSHQFSSIDSIHYLLSISPFSLSSKSDILLVIFEEMNNVLIFFQALSSSPYSSHFSSLIIFTLSFYFPHAILLILHSAHFILAWIQTWGSEGIS